MRLVRTVVGLLLLLPVVATTGAASATIPTRSETPDSVRLVTAAGDVDDFSFESMTADYTLTRTDDGESRLEVVETFTALFPDADQNRGMRRIIPDHYDDQPLFPELVSITDGDGAPRPAETDGDDGAFSMTSRADDFLRGRQVFVFTYTLENVTRAFDDTEADEFYWDVNGTDWRQSFGEVATTLTLGADLAVRLTGETACYRGAYGETGSCEITTTDAEGGAVVDASASDLAPYETVTIAVGFEPGTFRAYDTSYLSSPWAWVQLVALAFLAAALVWAVVLRRTVLGDAPGRPTIIAEYTPPPGIDALESAVMLGKTAKAIPAEVLEQAVRGSIRIVEGPKKWWGGVRLQAELVDPSLADGDGRMLLGGLFGNGMRAGDTFEFGRTDTRFSKAAQRILKAAGREITRRGLRREVGPLRRSGPIALGVLAGVVVGLASIGLFAADKAEGLAFLFLVVAFLSVMAIVFLVARTPLSAEGAEVRDHLKGLETFIDWAEADRIRMLQSVTGAERVDVGDRRQVLKLYEQLLPYAVVFGQEKQWAEHLTVLYGGGAPVWYAGSGAFNAAAFSAGVATLSATASSSSSSGGSSGGGSAGGGGGGGGGGGV